MCQRIIKIFTSMTGDVVFDDEMMTRAEIVAVDVGWRQQAQENLSNADGREKIHLPNNNQIDVPILFAVCPQFTRFLYSQEANSLVE
jgi:hypothetical protein